MNKIQNLTESQLKKKVIRISSKKKDQVIQNKQNMISNAATYLKKLILEPSIKSVYLANTDNQANQSQDFQCERSQDVDQYRPFYMETSRRQLFTKNRVVANEGQLPMNLRKFVQATKIKARKIWTASHKVQRLFMKNYFKSMIESASKIKSKV